MSHFTPINDSNCPCGNPGFRRSEGESPIEQRTVYRCDTCWHQTKRGESPPAPRHYSCCCKSDDVVEIDLIFWQGGEEEGL